MRVVVAGAGETGLAIAVNFTSGGHDVILLDHSVEALRLAEESLDVMTLEGDVTHRDVLHRVEAGSADAFVAVTASDTDNIVGAGLAKQWGARVAIARADDPRFYPANVGVERGLLGIDAVFCATRLAAAELVGQLVGIHLLHIGSFASYSLRAALVTVGQAEGLTGKPPLTIARVPGVRLCGVVRDGFVRPPVDIPRLEAEDQLLLVGDAEAFLDAWVTLLPEVARQRILVVGGGDVGALLAQSLARRFHRVELIERDRVRAQELSEDLPGVTVVHGDARQAAFLKDLQIDAVGYLLAVTPDDEINLLVSLLARRLGVPHVLALLKQPGHAELFRELGVQGAAGAFEVLARAVQDEAVLAGAVREVDIPGTAYMLLEWRLPAGLVVEGEPPRLGQLPLTAGASVVAIARGALTPAPTPEQTLEGGVSLVLSLPRQERDELTRRLTRLPKEWRT